MIEFVCPQCKRHLTRNDAGFECSEHGHFRVRDGLPHLMAHSPAKSSDYFQGHWEESSGVDYPATKLAVAHDFLAPLLIPRDHPVSVLDVGCGDGVHAKALDKSDADNLNYCGVDISIPALYTAAYRNNHSTFAVASAEELPFEDSNFDVAFSYGVLAYTASPQRSFAEMVRVTKRGGLIGVWFYPKPSGLPGFLLRTVRSLVQVVPGVVVGLIANTVVPFLGLLPTSSSVSLRNATWAQCKEVVLVNIAPEQLWYPTDDEVLQLFCDEGIDTIEPEVTPRVTIWGVKR